MKKIILLCGGPSSEYDISILTSQSIVNSIDYKKYHVSVCLIDKDKECLIKRIYKPESIEKVTNKDSISFDKCLNKLKRYDVVLLGTHGQFGEDGVLQTYLDQASIEYTGSDAYSSRLCMDKYRSSIIVKSELNISIPKTELIKLSNLKKRLLEISLPVFIKPNRNGSSVCSHLIKDLNNLDTIINDFYNHHNDEDEILIQELIDSNVEISCGCLEKKDHTFIKLPPIEIIPKSSNFFDYKSKYKKGASLERIPAIGISKENRERISKLAIDIHKLLGCKLYSRSDFLVKNNTVYYLETNTLPGMTQTSLIPQETNAIGISYTDLISFYIENT